MSQELQTACEAARRAGALQRAQLDQPRQIQWKGAIDPVTEIDRESEALITEVLTRAFPGYGFLGEESGALTLGKKRWIVDPLDGTTNYARRYPFFAVSIALECEGLIEVGVVYNPVLDELFTAERSEGALLNGSPIRVSETAIVQQAVLATGFPYDAWTSSRDNAKEFQRFIKQALSLRSDGSAALDLCHVACGRLDGYWELDLEAWDMAAGALIVQEAGGLVTNVDSPCLDLFARSVVAANPGLHAKITDLLHE